MDSSDNKAIVGEWKDFSTGELLLTVPERWGLVIIAIAGIWISWSVKYIEKILGNVVIWYHLRRYKKKQRQRQHLQQQQRERRRDSSDSENTALLHHRTRNTFEKRGQPFAKILKEKNGVRDILSEAFSGGPLRAIDRFWLLLFTALVAFTAAGMLVGVYYSAKLQVDGPARMKSEHCGLWVFNEEKRSDAATRAGLLDLEKERRAAEFAEDCYGKSAFIDPGCRLLYRPRLPTNDVQYTNDCPFQKEICLQNQTVTFTTPLIDASDIGIHSPTTPKFRRTTTCSPLSMRYPYIQEREENGTTVYYYYYGEKPGDDTPVDYTYKTVGDPWDRLAPVYDVFTYVSNAENSKDTVWRPRAELTYPEYSTLTILFISSLRILYKERSDDPIFPADQTWAIPGDPKPWFRNSDPRARPLACINTIEVCTADATVCWNINAPSNDSIPEETPELIFLYASLYKTDIYYSIAKRQGRGLQAQKVVAQYFSETLGDDPWVREVESLFTTSLARTQINAWSVASGEDSVHEGKDGYISLTKKYGNLCGLFKYNPRGYRSLRFIPFVFAACSFPVLLVLSWGWRPIESWALKQFTTVKGHLRRLRLKTLVWVASNRQGTAEDLTQSQQNSPPLTETTTTDYGSTSRGEPSNVEGGGSPATPTRAQGEAGSQKVQDNGAQVVEAESTVGAPPPSPDVGGNDGSQTSEHSADEISEAETQIEWEPLVWFGLLKVIYDSIWFLLRGFWYIIRRVVY